MRLYPAATSPTIRQARLALGSDGFLPGRLLSRTMLYEVLPHEMAKHGGAILDLADDIQWGAALAMMVQYELGDGILLALVELGCRRDFDHDPVDPDPTEAHVSAFLCERGDWRALPPVTISASGKASTFDAKLDKDSIAEACAAGLIAVSLAGTASTLLAEVRTRAAA